VLYKECYRGIDTAFYGHGSQLEYDFQVSPAAQPSEIAFLVDDADEIKVRADGGLDIVVGGKSFAQLLPPVAYQLVGSARKSVRISYRLSSDRTVAFQIGEYDRSSKLIIDPVVAYANYLPGAVIDVSAAKIDSSGNLIVSGVSGNQVGLVKLNAAGNTILYSTQIGTANTLGAYPSSATSLTLDSNGNAYVAGTTTALDFPVTSSNLGTCGQSCYAGFVAKFTSEGTLAYSTLLASGEPLPKGIVADAQGNAYVAGSSGDASLQTVNAFQSSGCSSCGIAFFAKLNPAGTGYVFASYFSGNVPIGGSMLATSIALDGAGDIIIAGETNMDPPLVNPWQSGAGGIFLSKFAPDGKTLLFSTRFGSSQNLSEVTPAGDVLAGMAIGSDGTVFLAGYTQSQDFPFSISSLEHQLIPNGYASVGSDMFAAAIDPTLTKLIYCVYLGQASPLSIAIDSMNHLYITGSSSLTLLPLVDPLVSDVSTGGFFLALDQSGTPLMVSQFGGHNYPDSPSAIAVDSPGNIYLIGDGVATIPTVYFNFPGQPDPILVGSGLGFSSGNPIAKISPASSPQISLDTVGPFLTLRNTGTSDLHISNITLGGSLSKQWGSCGSTIPAAKSCILLVTDSNEKPANGSVTISSDADPPVQVFQETLPYYLQNVPLQPIGDQLWAGDPQFIYLPQFNGTTSPSIPMTLWNVGTVNATINSITATGSLSETDNCGTQSSGGSVLIPGANCVIHISLTPGGDQPELQIVYDTNQQADIYNFYQLGSGAFPATNQLLLSANALNFGTQQVNGVAIPRTVTATNIGDTSLSAPSASVYGDTEFTLAGNTCISTLAPHQSCVVAVQFIPTLDATPSGILQIAGQQVALSAQGQIGSIVQVSPLELDFPPTTVPGPYTMTLKLTNTSSSAVGIAGVSFSSTDFNETDNCQGQVSASGSCTLQVSFSPQALGPRQGYITVNFSNGALTQVVTLTGTGLTPLQVSPSSLDFGSGTAVGSSSATQGVSIGNGGPSGPLPYTVALTGDFAIVQDCQNPMPKFTGCVLGIAFAPQTPGFHQGSLTVGYPGLSEQSVVNLVGSTTGSDVALASSANFGTQALYSTAPYAVAVTNSGNANLVLSSFTVSGANASDFSAPPGQCGTIGPGATCNIQVNFSPGGEGNRAAILTLSDNALDSPQSIALSAAGAAPFTVQLAGTSAFEVKQGTGGSYPLAVSSVAGFTGVIQFSCAGAPPNGTCSVQPSSLNFSAAATATVSVIVTTSASTSSSAWPGPKILFGTICFPPFLLLRRRRSPLRGAICLVLILTLVGLGCGGGGSTPDPSS
jgi:hypothetical protein